MKLQDKMALVTGAGRGLGRAIAQGLAREGARLVVCDVDTAALDETRQCLADQGATVLALRCDVSDRAAVDAMFADAAERFGTVDILVNNAARVPSSATETQRHNLFQMLPLGRLGTPEEYANVAVFLASGGHCLVGQVISPNGGYVI